MNLKLDDQKLVFKISRKELLTLKEGADLQNTLKLSAEISLVYGVFVKEQSDQLSFSFTRDLCTGLFLFLSPSFVLFLIEMPPQKEGFSCQVKDMSGDEILIEFLVDIYPSRIGFRDLL